jgi:hypothetical protein
VPTSWGNSSRTINSYAQYEKLRESIAPAEGWWPFALLEMTTLFLAVVVEFGPGALWPIPCLIGP